jgi:hypothetical protein
MRLKTGRVHDDGHLDFIRSLPCVSCGDNTATEASHLRAGNLRYGKPQPGMQEKPSDKWALPLCSRCHRRQHHEGEERFWKSLHINPWILSMTLHGVTGNHELAMEVLRQNTGIDA